MSGDHFACKHGWLLTAHSGVQYQPHAGVYVPIRGSHDGNLESCASVDGGLKRTVRRACHVLKPTGSIGAAQNVSQQSKQAAAAHKRNPVQLAAARGASSSVLS
jgi:hypothetical protein